MAIGRKLPKENVKAYSNTASTNICATKAFSSKPSKMPNNITIVVTNVLRTMVQENTQLQARHVTCVKI